MATAEWLRTFVAIYRTGSVTEGAALRNLSQPAASQQLRSLERSVGTPLFVRTPHGVEPTRPGRELYVSVADALDRLEPVLDRPRRRRSVRPVPPALRLGSSPEYFTYGRRAGSRPPTQPAAGRPVRHRRRSDLASLAHGELDVAVTTSDPGPAGPGPRAPRA